MTDKQQRFVDEYLIDLNATAAYKRAGYAAEGHAAEVNASRTLSNAEVSAAIAAAQSKRSTRTAIDQDYVLDGLKKEAELTGEGSSHSARIRALELLGKHLGMFADRVEHSGKVSLTIPASELTDDELASIAADRTEPK